MSDTRCLERLRTIVSEDPETRWVWPFLEPGDADGPYLVVLMEWYQRVRAVCESFGTDPLAYLDRTIAIQASKP